MTVYKGVANLRIIPRFLHVQTFDISARLFTLGIDRPINLD